ncbi:hypothetical protein [Flavobacterium aquicola]|uniref:DUF3575 domain-containing protein n=1 Tax=Flavobacterium aquicola TaxID=1682742 RepID=A0A3E0ESW9_9FLAO|nr:hypothetical protein [Flavobacterium aquicola]REH01239.1 hypothetical protein C8P67_102506 [Flavobacterium aquicola]
MRLNFKILFLLILFICSSISFSQEIRKQSSWIIKTNPTALIDIFTFPTVQLAIEKKINDSFSIQTEVGYQFYDMGSGIDTVSVKVGGFKINTEGRFYFCNYFKNDKTKKRNSDGLYTGIQVFYRENKYNESTSYYKSEIDDYETYEDDFVDNFGVIKKNYGANLIFGFQKQFYRFIIEPYFQLGCMNRKVKNIDREFNEDLGHIENNGNHDFFGYYSKEESSGIDVNLGIGFRIGYRF